MDEARLHLQFLGFTCEFYVVKYEPFAVTKHITVGASNSTLLLKEALLMHSFYLCNLYQSSLAPLSMTLRWTLSLQDLRSWEAS